MASGIYAQSNNQKVYYTVDGETGEFVRVESVQQEVRVVVETQPREEVYYTTDKTARVIETMENVLQTVAMTGATLHLLKHGVHCYHHGVYNYHRPPVPYYHKSHFPHRTTYYRSNRRR